MLSADYQKGLEKIVLEKKKESMHSAWIGQLVAELLGGCIDSRKEIDLWLLNCLMRYKRRTMVTLPASGQLNSRIRPIIANIPNAAVIQDDIVVATADKKTHYQTLEAVITALEKAGLTISPICQI